MQDSRQLGAERTPILRSHAPITMPIDLHGKCAKFKNFFKNVLDKQGTSVIHHLKAILISF